MKIISSMLKEVYPNNYEEIVVKIKSLLKQYEKEEKGTWVSEKDVMLITYGDSLLSDKEVPLQTLKRFLDNYSEGLINNVHLLPMFPYSSDDGFSVIDYLKINKNIGTWNDIKDLRENYNLMFDAVLNHISKESEWFKEYLKGNKKYENYFIEVNPSLDYSKVVRPRALPLFHEYQSSKGIKHIWTTFSEDQVDLNYKNPNVLIDMLNVLLIYAKNGAKFIRFDAVGFLWKKLGTPSIHLKETHLLFKVMRRVLDKAYPNTIIVSETNVPHLENVSYFGKGDEAHMVYQFTLPPLVMFSVLNENTTKLLKWSKSLDDFKMYKNTTFFNFLSSHDGVGLRPIEDILTEDEKETLYNHTINEGGKINYKNNPDGTKTPYELNINYLNAITNKEDTNELKAKKFLAAQAILLSIKGMPAIYIHSLLGSTNYYKGVVDSGINRRINREKLNYHNLIKELNDKTSLRYLVFNNLKKLLKVRKQIKAFNPNNDQKTIKLNNKVFSVLRKDSKNNEKVLALINVSNKVVNLNTEYKGVDLIKGIKIKNQIALNPYEYLWIEINDS